MIRSLLFSAAVCIAASTAQAEHLGCTPAGSVKWWQGTPTATLFDGEEEFGPIVFGIDMETGRYLEHLVGGRAGISGGGTIEVIDAGDATGRRDFVGRDHRSYFRIAIWNDPMSFIRVHDEGDVEIGTCVATADGLDFYFRPAQ